MGGTFRFGKNLMYFPVRYMHQRIKGTAMKFERDSMLIAESSGEAIIQILSNKDIEMPAVIDFSGISRFELGHSNKTHFKRINTMILAATKKQIDSIIETDRENKGYIKIPIIDEFITNENGELIPIETGIYGIVFHRNCSKKLLKFISECISDNNKLSVDVLTSITSESIDKIKERIIAMVVGDYLKKYRKISKDEMIYLDSSNIFLNQYINVKEVFNEPEILGLVIDRMCEIVVNSFEEPFDLIGVSTNGSMLASIVAYALDREVSFFSRLGPKYTVTKRNNLGATQEGKRLILISDLICMGTEVRVARALIDASESDLIGGVAILKIFDVYRDPKSDENANAYFHSLIADVNSKDLDFGYKVNLKMR